MVTQTLLQYHNETKVYWLTTQPSEVGRLRAGQEVVLAEEGVFIPWRIVQVLGEYSDKVELPSYMRQGTILSLN